MIELHIKNMVCNRCVTAVRNELIKIGLHPLVVEMGMVRLAENELSPDKLAILAGNLNELGFGLLDNSKTRMIEQVKNLVIEKIHRSDTLEEKVNWSKLISDTVFHEYNYVSSLFSSVEGITLEQYIIRQKIEKVKELLFYDELNLGEIANKLGYSSIAHVSAQFKKITGQTPSQFKNSRSQGLKRRGIDNVK